MSFFNSNPEVLQGIKIVKADSLVAGTVTVWSPPGGNVNTRFIITDLTVMIDGGTNGTVSIYEDTLSTANLIYRFVYDNTKGAVNHHQTYNLPYVPARGKSIKIDNPSGAGVRVILHGYEAY